MSVNIIFKDTVSGEETSVVELTDEELEVFDYALPGIEGLANWVRDAVIGKHHSRRKNAVTNARFFLQEQEDTDDEGSDATVLRRMFAHKKYKNRLRRDADQAVPTHARLKGRQKTPPHKEEGI